MAFFVNSVYSLKGMLTMSRIAFIQVFSLKMNDRLNWNVSIKKM